MARALVLLLVARRLLKHPMLRACAQAAHMTHSDRLGEAIPLQEARFLLNAVYDILQLQVRARARVHVPSCECLDGRARLLVCCPRCMPVHGPPLPAPRAPAARSRPGHTTHRMSASRAS